LKDGPAAGAQFYYPMGLASDAFGAAYVADTYNNRVVKIPRDRLAYIMAGNGSAGFSDGPGVAVEYNSPFGVGRDAAGNTYVTDQFGVRVRKINTDGLITTLAGNELCGCQLFQYASGVVADAQGNVYVADQGKRVIDLISPGGDVSVFAGSGRAEFRDGQGTSASICSPTGLAIDGQGNIYVADQGNNRIRKVTTPAAVVTTLAGGANTTFKDGTGADAAFWLPFGVAVDAQGNVYVADTHNSRIRKINSSGVVTTLAGDGTNAFKDASGVAAEFNLPEGIVVDTVGNIYVADTYNNRIRKINSAGVVSTLAGNGIQAFKDGSGVNAEFASPTNLTFDSKGNLYVSDAINNRIRKVTATGVVSTFSGNGVAGK
jgi:sugar lactone lactonase YvrE